MSACRTLTSLFSICQELRMLILIAVVQDFLYGFPNNLKYHFGGPNNKDYSILGSILGSPNFGKLPHEPTNCE